MRVYFEDTDLSGIVYHANYLRFMERARSDLLHVLDIDQRSTFEAGLGYYAVSDIQIRYRAPARLDDALLVSTRALDVRAASVRMEQHILRGDMLLTEAAVTAAFLSAAGRPQRQPAEWVRRFGSSVGKTL